MARQELTPRLLLGGVAALLLAALLAVSVLPGTGANFRAATDSAGSFSAAEFYVPEVRATTIQVLPGEFTAEEFTLKLDGPLERDYFVILRGAAGNASETQLRQPAQSYARVAGDPFGNFGVVTAPDELLLRRANDASAWQGQISVVESTGDATVSGFRLVDVLETSLARGVTSRSVRASGWADIDQVGLYGGVHGGGVTTTATAALAHSTAWARIHPRGSRTVNFDRADTGGNSLKGTTTFTTYVVEWGRAWRIQRVTVTGSSGGSETEAATYVTAPISPVPRARTFLLAYGHSSGGGIGDGWEGHAFTLGDGTGSPTLANQVAVGSHLVADRTAEVYVHSHREISVDHRFRSFGSGIPAGALTGVQSVRAPSAPETQHDTTTRGARFAIVANTSESDKATFPRPMVWARHESSSRVRWQRSLAGSAGAYWMQSVDFGGISGDPVGAFPLRDRSEPAAEGEAESDPFLDGTELLARGDRGPAVARLQELLTRAGFSGGAADGIFGVGTELALIAFQSATGLHVDGIAGTEVRTALRDVAETEAAVVEPEEAPVEEPTVETVIPDPGEEATLFGGEAPAFRDRGDAVATLQGLLVDLGHLEGPIDGVFGSQTAAALEAFQVRFGLEPTGAVDDATVAVLEHVVAYEPQVLRRGDTGPGVYLLQDLLRGLGFFDEESVGVFGPLTEDAVRAFQQEVGLVGDGVVGRATAAALGMPDRG